jgi:hypothetical protein
MKVNLLKLINIKIYKTYLIETITNQKVFYFRIKNIPYFFEKKDILDLLYSFSLNQNDIIISYDIFGRKLNEACVRVFRKKEFNELILTGN